MIDVYGAEVFARGNMLEREIISICVRLILVLTVFIPAQNSMVKTDDSIELARQYWEEAIKAKGGRDNLYKVESLALSQVRSNGYLCYDLYVFPDRSWNWLDQRPAPFGIRALSIDFEKGVSYSSTTLGKGIPKIGDLTKYDSHNYTNAPQLHYLLETKWLAPKPIKGYTGVIGSRKANIVEVKISKYRVAVYLDQETHLPFLFSYYPDDGKLEFHYEAADYREVNNVLIPHKVWKVDREYPTRMNIEINPAYDPMIFSRPPSLDAGAEQWRKTGSRPALTPNPANDSSVTLSSDQIAKAIKNLESSDKETVDWAIRELIHGGRQVVPALIPVLQSSNRLLRYRAAVTIGKIDERNPILAPVYADLLLDSQLGDRERQSAAFGLSHCDKGISILIDLLSHNDPIVKRCVIFAFDDLTEGSEIPPQVEKALPLLRELSHDKDRIVREMAREVLGQIGNQFKR